ncbi:family 114 glycoside hydrolase, partial [Microthyrium microscopicum]
ICYFSAGSSESWRDDFKRFSKSDMGGPIAKDDKGSSYWQGEKWLNIKNPNPNSATLPVVWQIMRDRIKIAADKGCNAIDPDNTDGYDNKNGIGLTEQDSINYVKFMAAEARKYNMSIGLKNSVQILPKVQSVIQFAVNEECAANGECGGYKQFLGSKPVFHI